MDKVRMFSVVATEAHGRRVSGEIDRQGPAIYRFGNLKAAAALESCL